MRKSTRGWIRILPALAMSLSIAACSGEPRANVEGADEPGMASEGAVEQADPGAGDEARPEGGEHERSEGGERARSERGGEHDEGGERGEHGMAGDEEGEETGRRIGAEDTWDSTRNGARLVLSFDPGSSAFVGTVLNTSARTLCAVRVEVHLSTGTELGPTEPTDLPPGETTVVELPTAGEAFDTWTAHPEISPCPGS